MIYELGLEYLGAIDDVMVRLRPESYEQLIMSLKREGAIFIGVGKSGMLADRAAATGRSLGLDTRYVHATEALHGDGGLLATQPVVAFSHSGNTAETREAFALSCSSMFSITSTEDCDIAAMADFSLVYHTQDKYTIPLASLIAMSLIIDAALLAAGDVESLKLTHPGGAIGKEIE